jgi:hypothetical protein
MRQNHQASSHTPIVRVRLFLHLDYPLSPQRSPVAHLLLAHEAVDVLSLSESEALAPEQHVQGVEVEVAVWYNKGVVVILHASHMQCCVHNRDIDALLRSLVELLLINRVEHGDDLLEKFDDIVEGGPRGRVHGGAVGGG